MIKVPLFSHTGYCVREGRVMQKDRGVTCMHVGKAKLTLCTLLEHFNLYLYTYLAIEGLSGGESHGNIFEIHHTLPLILLTKISRTHSK